MKKKQSKRITRKSLQATLETNRLLRKRLERTRGLKTLVKHLPETAPKLNKVPSVRYMARISMPKALKHEVKARKPKRIVHRDGSVWGTFVIKKDKLTSSMRGAAKTGSVILRTRIIEARSEQALLRKVMSEYKKFRKGGQESFAVNVQKYSGKRGKRNTKGYKEGRVRGGTAKVVHMNAVKRGASLKEVNDRMVKVLNDVHDLVFTQYTDWHKRPGGKTSMTAKLQRFKELLELYEED